MITGRSHGRDQSMPRRRLGQAPLRTVVGSPGDVPVPSGTASPTPRRGLDDPGTSPAYAMTAHGDLAYWNAAADAAFLLSSPMPPPHERDVLWRLFLDPALRGLYGDREPTTQTVLARPRADLAERPGNRRFGVLVEDLKSESLEFREWWPRHDVAGEPDGRVMSTSYPTPREPGSPGRRAPVSRRPP